MDNIEKALHNVNLTLKARGLGEEGHHALIKALENLAGIKVGSVDENEN